MELGDRIRNLARSKEISLNEVSRRSGVERSHLARILSGETKNPRKDTLQRLAGALGVSVSGLLGRSGPGYISVEKLRRILLDIGRLPEEVRADILARARGLEEGGDTSDGGSGTDLVADAESDDDTDHRTDNDE